LDSNWRLARKRWFCLSGPAKGVVDALAQLRKLTDFLAGIGSYPRQPHLNLGKNKNK
jgi:hypothetical protein